jgi:hypothetical protein
LTVPREFCCSKFNFANFWYRDDMMELGIIAVDWA